MNGPGALVSFVLQVLGLLVAPTTIGALLAIAARRRERLTRPHCARCAAALSFDAVVGAVPCQACSTPVAEAGAPRPERRAGARWASLLLLLGVLALAILPEFLRGQRFAVTSNGMPYRSTAALFADTLANRGGFELSELRRRDAAGEDVAGLARTAIESAFPAPSTSAPTPDATTGNAAGGPSGMRPPPPTNNAPDVAAIALLGVPGGRASPPPAPDFAALVLDRCFPPLAIDAEAIRRAAPMLHPAYTGFMNPSALLVRIAVVQRVLVDEVPILGIGAEGDVGAGGASGPPTLFEFNSFVDLRSSAKAISQGKRLTVELELRLHAAFDARRVRDHTGALRPLAEWPVPLATSTTSLSVDLSAPAAGGQPPSP